MRAVSFQAAPLFNTDKGFRRTPGPRLSFRRRPKSGRRDGAQLESLDVSVLLAQYGHLVLEQNGVQSHLGVHQGHAAKPAGKFVHAGLPLGEVVGVCPARGSGGLQGRKTHRISH